MRVKKVRQRVVAATAACVMTGAGISAGSSVPAAAVGRVAPAKPTPAPRKPAPAPRKSTPAPRKPAPVPRKPTPAPRKLAPVPSIALAVTATPSNIIIPLARTALVTGVVKGTRAARPVQLQLSYGRQWLAARNASSDRKGGYKLTIPSDKRGTFTYRVYAPAAGKAAQTASTPFSVSVGEGNPRSYELFAPAGRWNPCQVIGYRVNTQGAPAGALNDAKIAIANVARTTGLRYAYRGTTRVIPGAGDTFLSPYPKDTQLVIAWVKPGTSKHLPKGSDYVGYGGWLSLGEPTRFGSKSYYPITQGFVVVDRTRKMRSGFGLGDPKGLSGTWGQLVMHELGHTVGLTHVMDKKQLMYPYLQYRAAAWGLGDLGGLYNLGARLGCFPASALPKIGLPSQYAGMLPPLVPQLANLATMTTHIQREITKTPKQVWAGDH